MDVAKQMGWDRDGAGQRPGGAGGASPGIIDVQLRWPVADFASRAELMSFSTFAGCRMPEICRQLLNEPSTATHLSHSAAMQRTRSTVVRLQRRSTPKRFDMGVLSVHG